MKVDGLVKSLMQKDTRGVGKPFITSTLAMLLARMLLEAKEAHLPYCKRGRLITVFNSVYNTVGEL